MLSVCYGQSEDQAFTGGADGKVYQWNKCALTSVQDAHKGPIFALQPVEKVNLLCTSTRDGSSTLVLVLKSALSTFSKVLDNAFKHLTNSSTF